MGDSWYMMDPSTAGGHPVLEKLFSESGSDGVITWDEFEPAIRGAYYQLRNAPRSLAQLKELYGDWNETGWVSHDVQGQMSAMRRRLFIREDAVWFALDKMENIRSPIIYPVGTLILGEHTRDNHIVETTSMLKRSDGFWDYFAYDASGKLTDRIEKSPEPLYVPTKCVGCHYGDKQFEPERSFPRAARRTRSIRWG